MKTYEGMNVWINVSLISAVVGECSASRPGRFTSREKTPGTRQIRGLVGPSDGLDDMEK
jgi:hypothetical protein